MIVPPPWLLKPQSRSQPLNEWHLGNLSQYITKDTYEADRGKFTICALEIPWTDEEEVVVEAFRLWLRKFRDGNGVGRKVGRKFAWQTKFRDLAIHRLSVAGYTRKQGLAQLGIKPLKDKEALSAPNWARAKRDTQTRIHRRYAEILSTAQRQGRNWRDCFIKQGCQQSAQVADK